MTDRDRTEVLVATFLTALGVAALTIVLALKAQGQLLGAVWLVSGLCLILAVLIGFPAVGKTWSRSRTVWRPSVLDQRSNWRASHKRNGNKLVLSLEGVGASHLPPPGWVQLSKKGTGAVFVTRPNTMIQAVELDRSVEHVRHYVFFPDNFMSSDGAPIPPPHEEGFSGCYMQVWWPRQIDNRGRPLAFECIPMWWNVEANSRRDRKCRSECEHAQAIPQAAVR
jgi:hypothetical protein